MFHSNDALPSDMELLSSGSFDDAGSSEVLHDGGAGFCHKYQLIGTALCGPAVPLTVTFVATVAILIAAEFLLGFVENVVRDTQYESVKNKVFQEMTGIGLLSFLTILINAGSTGSHEAIPAEYLHDLHHADLVMFIMSSLYLAQISTHMYLSRFQYKNWKIAGGTEVCEVIEQMKENSWSYKWWWWVLGDNSVRAQMEYKILFSIFCRKFNIRKTDFNFAAYLNESFRGYIITLIEDSFFVRLIFGALVGINLIRVNFLRPTRHVREHCDDECKANELLVFYAACGWALLFMCLVLVFISRMYEFRLICRAGISHVGDYRTFLLKEEEQEIGRHKKQMTLGGRQDSLTLNREDLKTTLQAIKEAKEDDFDLDSFNLSFTAKVRLFFVYIYVSVLRCCGLKVNRSRLKSLDIAALGLDDDARSDDESDGSSSSSDEGEVKNDDDDDEESQNGAAPMGRGNSLLTETDPSKLVHVNTQSRKRAKQILSKSNEPAPRPGAGPSGASAGHNRLIKQMSFATLLTLRGAIKHTQGLDAATAGSESPAPVRRTQDKRRQSVAGSTTATPGHRVGSHAAAIHGHSSPRAGHRRSHDQLDLQNLWTIFLWKSPAIYFSIVQILMFLHGAYCSFYVTNFLILPDFVPSKYRAWWHIAILLPILLIVPLMRYIIKVSSVIKALSQIKQEVVAKVMEDDDNAEKSCQYLRLKLTARLDQFCDGNVQDLRDTFCAIVEECDKAHNGYLNRAGFRYMLRKLRLHFTDKRFNEVMDVIDANFDQKLTADELFQFVYPQKAKELSMRQREKSLFSTNGNLIVPKKSAVSNNNEAPPQPAATASAKTDPNSVKARLTSLMVRGFGGYAKVNAEPTSGKGVSSPTSRKDGGTGTGDDENTDVNMQSGEASPPGGTVPPLATMGLGLESNKQPVRSSFKTMERIEDLEDEETDDHHLELVNINKQSSISGRPSLNNPQPTSARGSVPNSGPGSGRNLASGSPSPTATAPVMAPFHTTTPIPTSTKSSRGSGTSAMNRQNSDESKSLHGHGHGHGHVSTHNIHSSGRSRANSDDRTSPDNYNNNNNSNDGSKSRTLSNEQAALLAEATNKLYRQPRPNSSSNNNVTMTADFTSPLSSKPQSQRNSYNSGPSKSPAPMDGGNGKVLLFESPANNSRKIRFRSDTATDADVSVHSVQSNNSGEHVPYVSSNAAGAVGGSGSKYVQFEDDHVMTLENPTGRSMKKGNINNSSENVATPTTPTTTMPMPTTAATASVKPNRPSAKSMDFMINDHDEDIETMVADAVRTNRWSVADMDEAYSHHNNNRVGSAKQRTLVLGAGATNFGAAGGAHTENDAVEAFTAFSNVEAFVPIARKTIT